ncbi:MAG TPA: ABC transporter substrate-binding protein, partial [Bryobacteraceae bacterium]|nr:ABC transporter substrate-binding protein [Bryobacteraceae bacterium]
VFKYIPDMTGLKTQFVTGAIDVLGIAGITPDNLDEVKAVPGLKLYGAPSGYLTSFMFNNGLPVFQDPAVREALYLSMDKDAILNDIFYGNDIPTESYLPQQSWAYDPNLPKHVFDVAKANALLDQAGWKHGSDGIRKKNGVRLSFDCSTVAGNHLREQTQQFLQQGWQKIGAELSIKNYPAAVVWGDFWRKSQFQSTIVGAIFSIGSDPDASDRLGSWNIPVKTGTGSNTMQYANLEVDRLLHESVATLDQEKRRQNYWRVQELVRKDLPFLPIAQQKSTEGTKVKVQGYQPNINYRSNCWNARDWKWSA